MNTKSINSKSIYLMWNNFTFGWQPIVDPIFWKQKAISFFIISFLLRSRMAFHWKCGTPPMKPHAWTCGEHQQLTHGGGWRGWHIFGMTHNRAGGGLRGKTKIVERDIFGGWQKVLRMRDSGSLRKTWERSSGEITKKSHKERQKTRIFFLFLGFSLKRSRRGEF